MATLSWAPVLNPVMGHLDALNLYKQTGRKTNRGIVDIWVHLKRGGGGLLKAQSKMFYNYKAKASVRTDMN